MNCHTVQILESSVNINNYLQYKRKKAISISSIKGHHYYREVCALMITIKGFLRKKTELHFYFSKLWHTPIFKYISFPSFKNHLSINIFLFRFINVQ